MIHTPDDEVVLLPTALYLLSRSPAVTAVELPSRHRRPAIPRCRSPISVKPSLSSALYSAFGGGGAGFGTAIPACMSMRMVVIVTGTDERS